jgi:hypothetical protein
MNLIMTEFIHFLQRNIVKDIIMRVISVILVLGLIISTLGFLNGVGKHRSVSRLSMNQQLTDSGRNLIANINGVDLSYDLVRSKTSATPAIVFLPALIREKNEAKSIYLKSLCKKADLTFLCADYLGVGKSGGKFADGSVTRWSDDTISLIEKLIAPYERKVVLVGHGLGAWISIIMATKRPDLISGVVGLAADPDFTEELLWKRLPEDVKEKIMSEGTYTITWGNERYPISKNLIEDGRKNLLLTGQPGMTVSSLTCVKDCSSACVS